MIFNAENKGSEELYSLTGTWYASNDFNGIAHDVESAETDVARLIGRETLKRASNHYHSQKYNASLTSDSVDDILVRHVQIAVAYKAMTLYYARNQVSHENTGRKIKIGEHEKMPWAWQLEKDDAMMRDTYYRALGELYHFLDSEKLNEWMATPTRQQRDNSVIKTLDEFESVYPLDGSYYMFYRLTPFILEVQDRFVRPIAGDKYDDICSSSTTTLALAAKRFAALKVMHIAIQRCALEIFPSGISQQFSDSYQGKSGSKAPSVDALTRYKLDIGRQADVAMQELRDAIDASQNDYPLFPPNDQRNKFFTV